MLNPRLPPGQTLGRTAGRTVGNDRFVRALGYALWCAPLALVLGFAGHFVVNGKSVTRYEAPAGRIAAEPIVKPIMTQAILRPQKSAPIVSAIEITPTRESLLAMAFMPHADSIVNVPTELPPAPARAELTTASTPLVPPKTRAASLENRPWRMQTLRAVGVAQGLRLISDGAIVALAGVEPLDPATKCKRLDGVQESCSIRAASRLEVLTRGRTITCRVYEAREGEAAVAACKADKIDLADDLVKNGLARKAA